MSAARIVCLWKIRVSEAGGLDEIRCCGENKQGFSMNEERFNAFEKMLSDILAQYDALTEKLAALKAEGKVKTVTYRQLFANKLQYQRMLAYYRAYGLLDQDQEIC